MEQEVTFKNIMHCEICNDGIFIPIPGRNCECRVCECSAKRKTLLRLRRSGMEDSIASMRFDNFAADEPWQRQLLDTCRRFAAQDSRRFLYISGQPGSGKTHLGTAVCGYFINQGLETYYESYKQLMNTLKANVNEEKYQKLIKEYGSVEVLYIDDFMKQQPTRADIDHTFELINMRVIGNRRTVITSERPLSEIIAIDEALGSRIRQKCGEFTIDIARREGRNYRMRDAAAGTTSEHGVTC